MTHTNTAELIKSSSNRQTPNIHTKRARERETFTRASVPSRFFRQSADRIIVGDWQFGCCCCCCFFSHFFYYATCSMRWIKRKRHSCAHSHAHMKMPHGHIEKAYYRSYMHRSPPSAHPLLADMYRVVSIIRRNYCISFQISCSVLSWFYSIFIAYFPFGSDKVVFDKPVELHLIDSYDVSRLFRSRIDIGISDFSIKYSNCNIRDSIKIKIHISSLDMNWRCASIFLCSFSL